MAAGKLNLTIEQGATFLHTLAWKDANDVAINLTGYTARMQIRESIDSSEVLLELTTGDDDRINIPTPSNGQIILSISATDTAAITWTKGVYDLELVAPSGAVTRLVEGRVKVNKEVTR